MFTNDKHFSFRVNTETKEIKLPKAALEYLWCACYAFYIIYREYSIANADQSAEFDLDKNEKTRDALSLYKWGILQLEQSTPKEWPKDKAKPEKSATTHEDIKVTNELYLCAAAWILHHEFGHILLNHKNSPINNEHSRAQEREADESATKWILDGVTDEDKLQKRGLGIAIAALVLTSRDILAGEFKETTHPKSFERLYEAINPYFPEQDHLVYAFSTIILHVHMAIAGMPIIKDDNETWKENLETCLVQFSRQA